MDGKAIDRLTDQKHDKYPELVTSDRVHYVVLACEEGGRWGPDVFTVEKRIYKIIRGCLEKNFFEVAAQSYTNMGPRYPLPLRLFFFS